MHPRKASFFRNVIVALVGLLWFASGSYAHPHVFVDGGVEFTVDEKSVLNRITVTWRYDAFETMFILTDLGILSVDSTGFTPAERTIVEENLSQFSDDFDGSVHLSAGVSPLSLGWPRDLQARMVGDRLEISFVRDLDEPHSMAGSEVSAAFYEKTYFFAFKMTDLPSLSNSSEACTIDFQPFSASEATHALQTTLESLSREDTPADNEVGSLFADRAIVSCNTV